jgi:hypothetical protein
MRSPTRAISQIFAIVYMSEGNSCRCLQVDKSGHVRDLVEAILALQDEWEEIGRDTPSVTVASGR